ncbi:MAG: hypothetical protein C5B54_01710 [Acidobacteria bacterium]|nr:MAG: hypothetical protein C5B54_01710 [Acidobacteriota bacterium]
MKKRPFISIYLLIFVVAGYVQAGEEYAAKLKKFEDYVTRQMKESQTPGLAIGFMKDDYVWVKGFGYADLENQLPTRENSSYRLGSVTKPMTATAVLQLVESGKINLDAEVQTYVSYFPKKPWPITVRELLGHLGGISHYKNYDLEGHIKEHKTTREAIAIFENFDLVAQPGTKFSYSSYGYNLLGAVIEGASGESYGQYMQDHIWNQAGMNDTHMDDPSQIIANRVRGYRLVDGKVKNSEAIDISSRFAAGGTRSTIPDLLKFAKALIDGKLLSPASFDSMSTSMVTKDGRLTDYGMGWDTEGINGHFEISHSGGQQETRTILYIFPTMHFAVAAATNYEDGTPNLFARRLYETITGETFRPEFYSNQQTAKLMNQAIQSIFNDGASYFDKYRKAFTTNERENAEAFAYFQKIIATKETAKQIENGRHPNTGQPFVKMGSYMTSRVENKSADGLDLFNDYIALYHRDSKIPKQYRFSSSFEKQLQQWKSSWDKTNIAEIRDLNLTPQPEIEAAGVLLKRTFAGASVYPDLSQSLSEEVRQLSAAGQMDKAAKVAEYSVDVYPESDRAQTTLAVIRVMQANESDAITRLKKASALNPDGSASAENLNSIAYELNEMNRTKEALNLLRIAENLYPKSASLYDSAGELYLKLEQKDKAIESFKKALELDPNLENSKKMLEKLTGQ